MRIYVGGLGGAVKPEDMEKTFSSMGRITNVELVTRSDGRRFAFMDFEPNSEKSTARLFANYNGCIWKGGKLKLEKASEHYMNRLKREWMELSEIKEIDHSCHNVVKKTESPRKLKFMTEEKKQLKVFFPKLRKLKSLPFKGTGKHKYSFQRVNIPPLPVHFCDCEEHCKSNEETRNMNSVLVDNPSCIISKDELSVMHSVLSKLVTEEAADNYIEKAKVEDISSLSSDKWCVESVDYHHMKTLQEVQETDNGRDGNGNDEEDDENFVLNIGSNHSRPSMDSIIKQGKELPVDKVSQDRKRTGTLQINEKGSSLKRKKTERESTGEAVKSIVPTSEQVKNPISTVELLESTTTELINSKNQSSHLQDKPEQQPTDDAQVKEGSTLEKSSRVTSWVQKSSWRDLVGDARSSSFSILHVVPGMRMMEHVKPRSSDLKTEKITSPSSGASLKTSEPTATVADAEPTVHPGDNGAAVKKHDDLIQRHHEENGEENQEKCDMDTNAGSTKSTASDNACTFMRTVASQQQWQKAKSAMSRYLKKKQIVNSPPNSPKGKSKRHRNQRS